MSTVQDFEAGDIVRSMDPNFEIVYQNPPAASEPAIGTAVVLDAINELALAGVGEQLKKVSVKTSLVDTETGNKGVLQRGYIVQTAGASTLKPDQKVMSDAAGLPIPYTTPTALGEVARVYGIVVGKANTNDQTQRVDALTGELTIIKVGDL